MHKFSMVSFLRVGLLAMLLLGAAMVPLVQSQQGKVLTIAFDASDLKTLDPHFAASTNDRGVVDMIFNGLVRYKPGDIREFEPDLAESWDVDGNVWTFNLREGVMCHPWNGNPGYELTSEDVVYSLEKSADPARSAYAGEYSGMTFEATGKYTVKITLDEAISEVLMFPKVADYAGGFIVCKQAVEDLGDDPFKTHPVGTGPFMFESYSPLEKVILAKNEEYFQGEPLLDGVVVRYIANVSARESGLETGELDVIQGPPEQPWVEKMEAKPDTVVEIFGPGETATLHLNFSKSPFENIRVRKAVAYCIDRDEARTALGKAISAPLYSAVPGVLVGGMTEEEVAVAGLLYKVDRDKAAQLLEEAGYPDGFSVEVTTSEMAEYLLPMQNIQAQLRQCGIDIQLKVVDHSSMHTLIRQDVNPIVLYVAWRPNADVFLSRFYHSDSIVVTGAKPDTNFSHYTGLDALIEAAKTELDAELQTVLWKQAQLKLLIDAASYPLYIKQLIYARNSSVDFGYPLLSCLNLYPPINELTSK